MIKQDPGRPHSGTVPLWRETLVWVAAPGFTLDADRPVPLVASPAPCVYRRRATQALEGAGRLWTGIFTSPSFSGCLAAVRAGLGVAVMPRAMVPPGLDVLTGWPDLAPAELAILGRVRPSPPLRRSVPSSRHGYTGRADTRVGSAPGLRCGNGAGGG